MYRWIDVFFNTKHYSLGVLIGITATMVFLPAHIPSDINTYEKLAVWLGVVFEQTAGTREVLEVEGARPEKIAQAPIFVDANNNLRVAVRLSIPLDRAVYSDRTKKFWQFAGTIVDTTIAASFTAN